ncbi:Protein O-GlcNAc transferase [Bertholletia excelsa]
MCNRSQRDYDICSINSPIVLDPKKPIVYVIGQNYSAQVENIKPYPRKWDVYRMAHIKELTLTSAPSSPPCTAQHNTTALVFSVGGYTGDFFSDFIDEFIPLFITVRSISPSNDIILVISNARDWWLWKYGDLLRSFSKHPIITLDNDTTTRCFPSATVGLLSLGSMSPKLGPIPNSEIILDFHALLEKTYGRYPRSFTSQKVRPQLVLIGRKDAIGRRILNQAEVKKAIEEEGFDVIDFEPKYATTMQEAFGIVSSSHGMVGVYGAGLTHLLFLRPNSVFMQVVPIGTGWMAELCFGKLARGMGLEYIEYKIGVEESSLLEITMEVNWC